MSSIVKQESLGCLIRTSESTTLFVLVDDQEIASQLV